MIEQTPAVQQSRVQVQQSLPAPAPAPAPAVAAAAPPPPPPPQAPRQPPSQASRKKFVEPSSPGAKYIHFKSICRDFNTERGCAKPMDEVTRKCQKKFLHICNAKMAKHPCGFIHSAVEHAQKVG